MSSFPRARLHARLCLPLLSFGGRSNATCCAGVGSAGCCWLAAFSCYRRRGSADADAFHFFCASAGRAAGRIVGAGQAIRTGACKPSATPPCRTVLQENRPQRRTGSHTLPKRTSAIHPFLARFQDVRHGAGPARRLQPPRYAPREGKGEGGEEERRESTAGRRGGRSPASREELGLGS